MKILIINLILLIIAVSIFFPLTAINLVLVICKSNGSFKKRLTGYFRSTAISIDRYANYEFRTLWNWSMINKGATDWHRFGVFDETVSYALGKNKMIGRLSTVGQALCWVLDKVHKNHVELAVEQYENTQANVADRTTRIKY